MFPEGQHRAEIQNNKIQVSIQKYEGLFEKAVDLEVNDENLIQAGE